MISGSKSTLQFTQNYNGTKDSIGSFVGKIEVITNSNAIVYSIRILVIVLALLMGHIQSSRKKSNSPEVRNSTEISSNPQILFHRSNY